MLTRSFVACSRPLAMAVMVSCASCFLTASDGQGDEAFEAAIVKHAEEGLRAYPRLEVMPASLIANSLSLRYLITRAFQIEDYQLPRIPDWMESDRYSVVAKSGRAVDSAEMMTMLRNLLMTTFDLKVHHEKREIPVFALVIDKGGSKLEPLGKEEDWKRSNSKDSADQITVPIGTSIQDLVARINLNTKGPSALGRPVVDRTGLQGLYRIRLTYDVERLPDGRGIQLGIDYPSALVHQLGLRLEKANAPIDILVIDSAVRAKLDD